MEGTFYKLRKSAESVGLVVLKRSLKMNLELTSTPSPEDESKVIGEIRNYNLALVPTHVEQLCVFDRADSGEIIGGLVGKTYWNYLDISYLWVNDCYRNQGRATSIMNMAEEEAIRRGCKCALVDTYSFQALGFYKNLGYSEFGFVDEFSGNHTRHYLRKHLKSATV